MSVSALLRMAFAFNILVLAPAVWSLYSHEGRGALAVFEGKVESVDGLRLLVAALWSGVLVASALGLWRPQAFVALLLFQVIYKVVWLMASVWPAWRAGGAVAVPWGVTGVFVFIVAVWPFVIVAAWRDAVAPRA